MSRYLIERQLKTLWPWQRQKVLDVVVACLEAVEAEDIPKFEQLLDTLEGKSKLAAVFALHDCLRQVQFTAQILESLLK